MGELLNLHVSEISQHELGVNDFDVASRIDCRTDMMDIRVFEATNYFDNRIHFTDVTEELIPQTFARTRAFYQAGDIDKFNRRRSDFL